jgi:hypothetical protein
MPSRLIKRRMNKASLRIGIRITTQKNKVSVPFPGSE